MQVRRIFPVLYVLTKSTKLFKVLGTLKIVKPLITLGSMAISVLVYGFLLSPWFAVGLVAMLFVHEMGHVWAMRHKGLPTSAPVFIPMLGAVIFAPDLKDRKTEAYVGYGGPLLGTAGALAVFGLWAVLPSHPEILLLTSFIGLFLNLFNLIPIRPLDGGRITQVVGPWFKYLGLAMLGALVLWLRDPLFLLIILFTIDDFSWRPPLKCLVAIPCGIAAIVIFIVSMSGLSLWWLAAYAFLIALVIFIMWGHILKTYTWFTAPKDERVVEQELPYPPQATRLGWLGLYLTLTLLLIALLFLQIPHLPDEAK